MNDRPVPNTWAIVQSGNLFMFAMHNPVMFIDPSGHSVLLASIFFGALIGFTIAGATNYVFQGFLRGWDNIDMREVWFNAGLGAITGGIGGSSLAFGFVMAANAVLGAAHYAGTQFLRGEDIKFIELLFSAGFGALGGALGGTSAKYITRFSNVKATHQFANFLGLQSGQEINRVLLGQLSRTHFAGAIWRTAASNIMTHIFDPFSNWVGNQITFGSVGQSVLMLQSFLGVPLTGKFNNDTEFAVMHLQMQLGMKPTGIFDWDTANAFMDLFH